MKHIAIFILLIFFGLKSYTQDSIKSRVYLSLDEYKKGYSSLTIDFIIQKRTSFDIVMVGGNDFKVITANPEISDRYIKREIWAISQGDSTFINCFRLYLGWWYSKALTTGRYISLYAGYPTLIKLQKELGLNSMTTGSFGAVGGAASGASGAKKRFLYVYDTKTEKIKVLNSKTVIEYLSGNNNLLPEFNSENIKDDNIFLKYIRLLNKELEP